MGKTILRLFLASLALACARTGSKPSAPIQERLSLSTGYQAFCGVSAAGSNAWGLCPSLVIEGFSWEWGYRYDLLVETRSEVLKDPPQDSSSLLVTRKLLQVISKVPVEADLTFETEVYWDGKAYGQWAFDQVLKSFKAGFLLGSKTFVCQEQATCNALIFLGSVDMIAIQDLCSLKFHYAFQKNIDDPLVLKDLEYKNCQGETISGPWAVNEKNPASISR